MKDYINKCKVQPLYKRLWWALTENEQKFCEVVWDITKWALAIALAIAIFSLKSYT